MSAPKPPFPLTNHCSVIHNGTLYAVSGNHFYSLPLRKNGKWTKLPSPIVNTEGQVCVSAHAGLPNEQLYLVGGSVKTPTGSVPKDYAGIQRWSFDSNSWGILPLENQLLYNMTGLGSTFVEDSSQLLIYGGAKWPQKGVPSQQTYLISTLEPFATTSIPGGLCPPLVDPLVFPWDNGGLVCGGGAGNNHLFTYSSQAGWKELSASLDHGLSKEKMGATLMKGPDGSRMLLSFDFSRVPVEVKQTMISESTGNGRRSLDPRQNSDWPPKYNGTLAPKIALTGFSLASDDRFVTFLGGDKESTLNVFDSKAGSWMDPAVLLNVQKPISISSEEDDTLSISPLEVPSATPSSSAASSSSVASSASSSTDTATAKPQASQSTVAAASAPSTQNNSTTMKLLFIILGVVILVALILGLAYVILRCRRKKQATEKGTSRKGSTQSVLSIADRGVSYMKETGGSSGKRSGGWNRPRHDDMPKPGVDYPDFENLPRGSTVGLAAGTTMEMHDRHRGSGWSKYFSGNSQTNLVEPSRNRSTTCSDGSRSSYSMSSMPDEFDSRSISAPSLGHVRSSNATSSAVFSQTLPTPVVANVMGTSPSNGAGLVMGGGNKQQPTEQSFDNEKRATTLTMSSNFDTRSFASSFNDQPFWNTNMEASIGHAVPSDQAWDQPRIGDRDSERVPSSIYAAYMNNEDRDSSMTVFPGPFGFNNTPRQSGLSREVSDNEKGDSAQTTSDQGLSWFKRT